MPLRLTNDRPPVPPADLMLRVITPFGAEEIEAVRENFDLQGLAHLGYFERALAAIGRSFEEFDRLLDFGCGCGRFLRHLGQLADGMEIHGTDIDAEMIEWLRVSLPYGRFEVAPHEGPLPYPEHYFDLVINHSVFSHLDERLQDLWLSELRRITRPGGLVLLTVEGQSSWNRTAAAFEQAGEDPEPWRSELETRGIAFISDDLFVGSSHPDFYHSAVHAPWYVFEHWSRWFDIAAYIPNGSLSQDLIVLTRREDDAPPPRVIARRLAAQASAAPTGSTAPTQPPVATPTGARELADKVRGAVTRLAQRRPPASSRAPRSGPVGSDSTAPRPRSPEGFDAQAIMREVAMLRVGLYEQGRRISILAAQLRDEIQGVRGGDGRDDA